MPTGSPTSHPQHKNLFETSGLENLSGPNTHGYDYNFSKKGTINYDILSKKYDGHQNMIPPSSIDSAYNK